MKLTVLGGSAAGPNTGQGCSGYLISENRTRMVLDLGPGTLPELRKHVDFRTLDGIVISHMHLDHVLDLLALRFALANNPIPAPLPTPLWLPPGGSGVLGRTGAAFASPGEESTFFAPMFAITEYDPLGITEIGDCSVSFARTVHSEPCWAVRVSSRSAPGRDLVYTADTGPEAGLRAFGDGAAVLLAEATLAAAGDEPTEARVHMTAAEAGELATQIGAERLVLTHLWEELGRDAAAFAAARTFAGPIEVALPGLGVSW